AALGMPLLIHGEVTSPEIDVFDREAVFIETVLEPLRRRLPALKIVLEHATTKEAVDYVAGSGPNTAATITPHHLVINRNALFNGGLRPHLSCLPIAKREVHRLALRRAATSGDPHFFLGTDSAPHPIHDKEKDCGCAGVFNAPAALETYVRVFDEEGALDRFEAFASLNGPRFYGLPVNEERVTLRRQETAVPERVPAGPDAALSPFLAGERFAWRSAGGDAPGVRRRSVGLGTTPAEMQAESRRRCSGVSSGNFRSASSWATPLTLSLSRKGRGDCTEAVAAPSPPSIRRSSP